MVVLQTPRKNASLFAPVVPEIEVTYCISATHSPKILTLKGLQTFQSSLPLPSLPLFVSH